MFGMMVILVTLREVEDITEQDVFENAKLDNSRN